MLFSGSIQIAGHNYMKTKRMFQRGRRYEGGTTNPVSKKAKKLSAQGATAKNGNLTYPRGNLARTSTFP